MTYRWLATLVQSFILMVLSAGIASFGLASERVAGVNFSHIDEASSSPR